MPATDALQLVYIGDPMCSWCWGFAPVLDRLVSEHDLDLRIVVGGLRPGRAAQPLAGPLRAYLLQAWDAVAAASGQPFDPTALDSRPETWMYDTELPAVAVTTMRRIDPAAELAFFLALQRAFYADGVDITDAAVYPDLLSGFDVDAGDFADAMAAPEALRAAWDDFAAAQQLGATGFPTTLLSIEGRYRMLAAGYRPFTEVDQVLHAALERFAPAMAPGAACSLDGRC
ncbi:MAG TPA: DsbA family protein [Acidimicrobiia bacterium]|jgi:putative protein-disulfide isomerase|nr:DsbA family protein [Acidimicrobiia bacterium]